MACDRQVKVFYNLTGQKVLKNDLKSKLKTAKTEASKERIEQMIETCEYIRIKVLILIDFRNR